MDTDNSSIPSPEVNIQVNETHKKSLLKWDNTFNIAHVLTLITIVAAFFGLYFQKKAVDVKVKDLQAVVNDLEDEKKTRELSALDFTTSKLNGDNYNLEYTTSQLRATEKITDQQFIETLDQINRIVKILLQSKTISQRESDTLNKIKSINLAKQEIYAHKLIYTQKTEEFETQNRPKRENYKNEEQYLIAQKTYIDTLQKNTSYLLKKFDSLLQGPKKTLKDLY